MTIGLFAVYYAPYGGNVIAQQLALCGKLRELGHDAVMVFPEQAKERDWCLRLKADGRRLRFLPLKDTLARLTRRIVAIIREERLGGLHSTFNAYDNAAAIAAQLTGRKCVIHVRSHSEPRSTAARLLREIKVRIFFRRACLMAVSDQTLGDYSSFGMKGERSGIIPEAVCFERLEKGLSRAAVRQRLAIERNARVFLMMGYDIRIKGVDTALEAFAEVCAARRDEPVRLCIVVADGDTEVERYAKRRFGHMPGWLRLLSPIEHVGEYYRASDYFISASRTEGFPNALIEACYMELPVLASHIPGTSWVREFETSSGFEPGAPSALAASVTEALSTEWQAEALRRTRNSIFDRYGLDAWAGRIVNFYKRQGIV